MTWRSLPASTGASSGIGNGTGIALIARIGVDDWDQRLDRVARRQREFHRWDLAESRDAENRHRTPGSRRSSAPNRSQGCLIDRGIPWRCRLERAGSHQRRQLLAVAAARLAQRHWRVIDLDRDRRRRCRNAEPRPQTASTTPTSLRFIAYPPIWLIERDGRMKLTWLI